MKCFSLILMLISFQRISFSQDQRLVDSLQTTLKNATGDTARADILYALSKAYWGNNPDSAMDFAKESLSLSEKIGYKKGMGNAYNSMGAANKNKADYLKALYYFESSMKIREEIGDKKGIAGSYGNIGLVYESQGNYPKALKNHFQSLKLNEEIGNKYGMAMSYNNIGLIYTAQSNYALALKNHLASLKIEEELGEIYGMAMSYNNIGTIYSRQGFDQKALQNYYAALKILETLGDKQGISVSFNNIGEIYEKQGNYSEALKNHFISLKIKEEGGDKYGIAYSYGNIGNIFIHQTKYKEAAVYLNKALVLSKEIGSMESLLLSYEGLSKLDSAQGHFKQALEYYKLYIACRDSMFNEEDTKKTVQQQMQYEFDKKETETRAITDNELNKQKFLRNSSITGFAVVLLFAGIFFRQRNKTKKEMRRSDELLLNILPEEVADEIKTSGTAKAKAFTMVTVMFTDFKDFTALSERISAELLVDEIHTCFSAFDTILIKYGIEKIKTIGDAYLCASGLPVSNYTHAMDMVNAALEIRAFMLERKKEKDARGEIPFELRLGIHTGPVVAGVVGVNKYAYDIWGDTVNIAARMEQNSEAGKVNISGTTYELVKAKFKCIHRGKIQAKNKGDIDMYFVESTS